MTPYEALRMLLYFAAGIPAAALLGALCGLLAQALL